MRILEPAGVAGQRWISTLFVTGYGTVTPDSERAADNLRRFLDAGGRVLYGTDLGNGDQPLGVNADELGLMIGAGLDAPALLDAITDPWPRPARAEGIATFVTGPAPDTLDGVPAWLATACLVPTEDLEAL